MSTVWFSDNQPVYEPTGRFRRVGGASSKTSKLKKAQSRERKRIPPSKPPSIFSSLPRQHQQQPQQRFVSRPQISPEKLDHDASVVGVSMIQEFIWPAMIIIAFIASVVYLSIYLKEHADEVTVNSISRPYLGKGGISEQQAGEAETTENFLGFDWARFDQDESEDEKKEQVVGVRSGVDGNKYKVAAHLSHGKQIADMFALMNKRSQRVIREISRDLEEDGVIVSKDGKDITMEMKRLVDRHMNKTIPLAEYRSPESKTVGANQGKGDIIEVCARSRYDPKSLNDQNTMFRVVLHELAHSADEKYQEEDSHGKNFERIHSHLLGVAQDQGTFSCEQYMQNGKQFCSLVLTENYC